MAAQLEAVSREHRAKVADLERRYAVVVEVAPVQLVEVVAPVLRLHLLLKRRKRERPFSLDWNAVTSELEPLPCELNFAAAGPRLLCDDAVHLLAPPAHPACATCGRERCLLCHPRQCPRCGVEG